MLSSINPVISTDAFDQPWTKPWPASDLERVPNCPVCGSAARDLLHEGLIDNVFFVAPGSWTLQRCKQCASAYLDPRPTLPSIGRAYEGYYTHTTDGTKLNYDELGLLRRFRRQLVNGYTRWRYSSSAIPASGLGIVAAFLVPGMRRRIDREYRHLPRPHETARRLLDVGSGSGAFLKLASSCGWDVVGVDPDPAAIEESIRNGLAAYQGGVERFGDEKELFDVITLCHVIEHLHDPSATIKKCFELLKPGGSLWLETPNINSTGSLKFGEHWRGVETPRHLVLFNAASLKDTFSKAGFTTVKTIAGPSAVRAMFEASYSIANGASPYQPIQLTWKQKLSVLICRMTEIAFPASGEIVTMIAKKTM